MDHGGGRARVQPLESRRCDGFAGTTAVPGDKSMSHRALLLAALAIGETKIAGLLGSEDILATAGALARLGVAITKGEGVWHVSGRGLGGLVEPEAVLDLGNAGTGVRLLMGVLATHPLRAVLTGDASLSRRPMARVMTPLSRMGARFSARGRGLLPVVVEGARHPLPIHYALPVPSAQVKSAILLAGLNAPGETAVIEAEETRDHTERMLAGFGFPITREAVREGTRLALRGQERELTATTVTIPGDFSSAAFPLVASVLVPGGRATLTGVGVNPRRLGLLDALRTMGAAVALEDERLQCGEPVATLVAEAGRLAGIDLPPEAVPSMIDEIPALAVAAACAEGVTRLAGLGELRVKESDRLAAIARGLAQVGVEVDEGPDWLVIHGRGRPPEGGATIEARLDHRIAMAFLVLGMVSRRPIAVDDAQPIDTSFPAFVATMNRLGARLAPPEAGGACDFGP